MNCRRTLSLSLSLSLLLSLASFVSTVQGQEALKPVGGTGIITLGPGQVLRITVNAGEGNDMVTVRFRRMGYIQEGNIYKVGAQDSTDPIRLRSGEGAFIDIPRSFLGGVFVGVRGVVLSSSSNVYIDNIIIDAVTGKAVTMVSGNTTAIGPVN